MNLPTFTVLMIEDLAADRELYRRALCQDPTHEYDLLEAESLATGLALCRTRSIDAVLLSYLLPDGNGLEFLERLSAQSNGSSPPVVMISGQGNERTVVRAIKLGAEDYLVKSDLTAELLLATLRSAIENTRLRLELKQCEERFGTAIKNLPDCFGIYSAIRDTAGQIVDFRLEYLNAAAMQSNRMADADMSKTLCEVLPAHRETGLLAEYAQVVETGIPLVKEDLVYTDVFGGELLTNAYKVQIAKLDDGFTASWRDITAQKQVELSLQIANQQITTIWESMTDAYVTLDCDWRFTYANSTATQAINQLLESPTENIIGKSHWDVFPWTVGTIAEREYRRAVTERVAVHFELFYQPAETWFEIHAYPSTEGLGIYFQDVNERKRNELARSQAEREIDRFFDISIDLLGVVNLDGYFARINPACEQILGFTSAEIMAQPFIDFLHPDDIAATMAVYESLSAGNVLVNFENRYRCRDGSYRWILWSAILAPERNLIYSSGRDITQRKRDEELLRQNEELTRRILESNRDWIKVVDLAGRLIYMNDYGQSLMEIDDFSTVARSQWLEFWQDRDRESARTAFSIALAGGVDRFDGYCATTKGTPKWWEVIVTPILAADGQVSQILSVSRDITERKIAELNDEFLYELTQRLRHFTDPEAIRWEAVKSIGKYLDVDRAMWYDVDEAMLARVSRDWNRAGVNSIVGDYPLNEFLAPALLAAMFAGEPMAISDVTVDPLTAAYNDNYQQVGIGAFANIPCLDDEGRWVMTLHLNTSQNVRIWRDDEIKLMQTLVTQLWSFVAEARAVQALRAQEEQTRAAQAIVQQQLGEIESIYQMAPVGLCFVDTDFRYVRINEQLALIDGLSVAEHIGKTFREVLPELVDTMEPVYRQVIESNEPIIDLEVTGTNRAQPGVERCWLASFYPQTDERGRVIGVNNVVQEITDRKQAQAELEERNRELDSFVYVVAHDLKAPLRAVANLSQWIEDDLDGQLTADTQSQMNLLRSRVNRMAATIDGLLDYARIGRSEDLIEPVALAKLLTEVIDSVAPPATFTIDFPAELPTLSTKRLLLFQVLVNLIGNGIKHHHSEAGKIQIAIAEQEDFYEFAVSDNGSGIAPEHQERMFKIFQAVNPQKRPDSTGIGLAIVKKIIEAEGGTIRLESEIGKGTTFYFTWPKCVV